MPTCEALKQQLNLLIEQRREVQEELKTAPPSERGPLIAQLKALNREIALKRQQYDHCVHPPLPKPDLVARTFQIRPNHQARTLEVSGVIRNSGDGPAHGPFQVTLGVSYTDRNLTVITRQLNIQIPAGVTIEGHGSELVTDGIKNLPLLYRTENPKFVYQLDMIVDSANQVSEVTESNNVLSMQYWTIPPHA